MAVIRVTELAQQTGEFARRLGERLGETVQPGDTVDFTDQATNSIVDSFVKIFTKIHGREAFFSLELRAENNSLFPKLLNKAQKVWVDGRSRERIEFSEDTQIEWTPIEEFLAMLD